MTDLTNVLLAGRHLDPTEGVMQPGHVVTDTDVSALRVVLSAAAASVTNRLETLAEAGRALQRQARQRFAEHGATDQRGAALWDAACYLVEQMGDGDWRRAHDPHDGEHCPEQLEVTLYGQAKAQYVCGCIPPWWGYHPIRIRPGSLVIVLPSEGEHPAT